MSNKEADKSNAGAWITGVAAALALYVLSIGPVAVLVQNYALPKMVVYIVDVVYAPVETLRGTPLYGSLEGYADWWRMRFKKP